MTVNKNADRALGIIIVLAIAASPFLCCGGCNMAAGWEYSEGYRDGVIQKFSVKGMFWKSHEGQLAMPGFRAGKDGPSNVFSFSVKDPAVIYVIDKLPAGQNVRLHYREYLGHVPWQSSTGYFIERVELLASEHK